MSFVAATMTEQPQTGAMVCVDWGLRETVTTTSDTLNLTPAAQQEHGRSAAQNLARYQPVTARHQPKKSQGTSQRLPGNVAAGRRPHKKVPCRTSPSTTAGCSPSSRRTPTTTSV